MSILDQLRSLSAAEDFFTVLAVPYDPAVLNVARLHILRRMGDELRRLDPAGLTEDALRDHCRRLLEQAHNDFVASSPLDQRVFKVLKEAVKPAGRPFVPLSALTARES